jgi:hypothetical protein
MMKFKGMPGLVISDGKNRIEFPFNGKLELKGKKARWLKGLIESGKVKGVEVLGSEPEQAEKPEEQVEQPKTEETVDKT